MFREGYQCVAGGLSYSCLVFEPPVTAPSFAAKPGYLRGPIYLFQPYVLLGVRVAVVGLPCRQLAPVELEKSAWQSCCLDRSSSVLLKLLRFPFQKISKSDRTA